eukprot:Opistho-2@54796
MARISAIRTAFVAALVAILVVSPAVDALECSQCTTDVIDAIVEMRKVLNPLNASIHVVDAKFKPQLASLAVTYNGVKNATSDLNAHLAEVQAAVSDFSTSFAAKVSAKDTEATNGKNVLSAELSTQNGRLTAISGILPGISTNVDYNQDLFGNVLSPMQGSASQFADAASGMEGALGQISGASGTMDTIADAISASMDEADDAIAATADFNTAAVADIVRLEGLSNAVAIDLDVFRNHVKESKAIVLAAVADDRAQITTVEGKLAEAATAVQNKIISSFVGPAGDVDTVVAGTPTATDAAAALGVSMDALNAALASGAPGQIASTTAELKKAIADKILAVHAALQGISTEGDEHISTVLDSLEFASNALEARMVEQMWPDEVQPKADEVFAANSALKLVGNATLTCGRNGPGTALSLNGTDGSYATMPSSFLTGADIAKGITVTAWVKQARNNNGYIFARTNPVGSTRYFALWSEGSRNMIHLFFLPEAAKTGYRQSSINLGNFALDDDTFHHVALVITSFINPYAFLYIDGKLIGRFPNVEAMAAGPTNIPFLIGARQPGGAFVFRGLIDDFRVFRSDLSGSIIRSIFNTPVAVLSAATPFDLLPNGGKRVSFNQTAQTPLIRIAPGTSGFVANVTSLTIAAWVTQKATDEGYIVSKTDSTGSIRPYGLYVSDKSDTILFYYRSAGVATSKFVSISSSIADGKSHHVAVSVSGVSVSFFLDGRLLGTRTLAGRIVDDPTYSIYVGTRGNGGAQMLDGSLANAQIFFNRAMCLTEIQALYKVKPSA